eukprot:c21232_g1_i3 orf=2-295(-)
MQEIKMQNTSAGDPEEEQLILKAKTPHQTWKSHTGQRVSSCRKGSNSCSVQRGWLHVICRAGTRHEFHPLRTLRGFWGRCLAAWQTPPPIVATQEWRR